MTLAYLGYHGESLDYNSKMLATIKSHGSTIFLPSTTTRDEILTTNRRGIILIRNPYRAIYGAWNYFHDGQLGHADASSFFGPGGKFFHSKYSRHILDVQLTLYVILIIVFYYFQNGIVMSLK